VKVALIGCSASKLDRPAPARELYRGELFRAAIRYAEPRFGRVFILSAKHALVTLDQVLEPYDESLVDWDEESSGWWAHQLLLDLSVHVSGNLPAELHVLAGRGYADPLAWQMAEWPCWILVRPLKGLGIGRQKAWLAREAA
jgi:hypothetical protein